jgi:hypothetical protein
MPARQATQIADYDKPPAAAFADVQRALSMIGEITSVTQDGLSVRGRSWYGLHKVRMEVYVAAKEQGSTITLVAFSDLDWAAAAKDCNQRLLEALANLDNPNYVPSKRGKLPSLALAMGGYALFLFMILILTDGMQALPLWLTAVVAVVVVSLGIGMVVYFFKAQTKDFERK